MDKKQLRKKIRTVLGKMTESQLASQSKAICDSLTKIKEFKHAGVVMIFLSLPTEVDTTAIILKAWQDGKTVAVPKVSWQQRHMIPVQINSLETGLARDGCGLKNPVTGVPVPIEDIDIVITPGLAFDKKGNRLGRGGGYFDRFFSNKTLKAIKCGVSYSQQVVDYLPTDQTDVPVDCLVTDKEILFFNS